MRKSKLFCFNDLTPGCGLWQLAIQNSQFTIPPRSRPTGCRADFSYTARRVEKKGALITGINGQDGSYLAERTELGWKPGVDFRGLVRTMVEADVALVAREQTRDPEERRLMVAAPVER